MKGTGFKNLVKKTRSNNKFGVEYTGYIEAWEDGRKLWSQSTKIKRLSRGDAIKDAQKLSHEYMMKRAMSNW